MKPITKQAYKLFHDGSLALSDVEANGLRIDIPYLIKAQSRMQKKIKRLTEALRQDEVFKLWRKTFGPKTNLASREQLGKILYGELNYPITNYTKTGKPQADETALQNIDSEFVRNLLRVERYKTVKNKYLKGIEKETEDNILHPSFNLHTARTFRSSSSNPNFQNIPIRNPEMGKIIRRCFIPRKNHVLVESDFKGIEVGISGCYNKDPILLSYIKDKTKDMHRDMAAECFTIELDEVSKQARYCAKSGFVFAQFYGDYYIHCAKNLWKEMIKSELKTVNGTDIKSILEDHGIWELGECNPKEKAVDGTFEKHIQEVEYNFWKKRFRVYDKWKEKWWNDYQKKGEFLSLTGFHISGVYSRNEIINYPVQGSAFHCLLWTLIEVNKYLKKHKMKSMVVGQIHDSIIGDVHKNEIKDYLEIVKETATVKLPEAWKWIIVPLSIDQEITPLGGSWYDKKEIKETEEIESFLYK